MMQETFMYTVNPRIPIRDLIKGEVVRKTQSLMLTAEEVEKCCRCGTVYRRFNASKIVKVTIPDIERLHRREFISEEDFLKMKSSHVEEKEIPEGSTEQVKNGEEELSRSDETVPKIGLPYSYAMPEFQPMNGIVTVSNPDGSLLKETDEEETESEFADVAEEDKAVEVDEDTEDEILPEDEDVEETPSGTDAMNKSHEDMLKSLDVFSTGTHEEQVKNGEEELSRSDSSDRTVPRPPKKKRRR